MQFSNTKEDGLETIIVDWLVKHNGYEQGTNADYNKEYAIDETRLFRFLADTQPDEIEKLAVFKSEQKKRTFLNRLQGELAKRGIIDVLRNGIKVYPADLIMFYLTPNENNDTAKALYAKNIFSVTRQLRYSIDAGKLALDLCIFINGLPVITFELKNQLTKQNVENAVQQYKDDRSPKEQIFSFKRCMVHFAVDDDRVKFCTKLAAQDSWFLPFDKGYNDGAGNPPNPNGLKTDYLWKEILTKDKLTRIIESYAQVVTEVDEETKKKTVKQIFPRYHQLDVVEKLIADVEANGVGNRYLIQHSAGSGKSNSIAWLAYRLMELEKDAHPIFNSILVVTDRRILDKQIRDNIKQFAQVGNVVAWAEHSGDLRKAITDGKRIIITTIEKFPYVVPDIGAEHKDNKFAILIDEAHSGQNGRNSAQMNLALSGLASGDHKYNGQEPPLTSAIMNGFADSKIPKEFKKDPYRFLVVADMFQTGFDEPLLHTMYVDKQLYDIQAVQTLSRLNRCHPKKHDTCVLDFANKPEIIQESFSRYYRTTILSGETDPNKLYDLISAMEKHQVYSRDDIENEVNLYLNGAQRDKLDYILDVCTNIYKTLEIEEQIEFKSSAKAFCRTYGFLGAILPYGNPEWEKLSIFLNLLIPKLPSPQDDDLSQGILETIDLDSYRTEARETMSIQLDDADSEMAPVPAGKSGHIVSPEMDLLSIIVSEFNDI